VRPLARKHPTARETGETYFLHSPPPVRWRATGAGRHPLPLVTRFGLRSGAGPASSLPSGGKERPVDGTFSANFLTPSGDEPLPSNEQPLSLGDEEMQLLIGLAQPIAFGRRREFLAAIAAEMANCPQSGPDAIYQIARAVQRNFTLEAKRVAPDRETGRQVLSGRNR
jgi:hypothetical protein